MMTLGSLFDGSGGFPLAGAMRGIKPVWASEIEPYPMGEGENGYVNRPHFQHEGMNGMIVTHWMPLPEPPREAAT